VPRSHYRVLQDQQTIGEVTSGTMSPSLQQAIGTALVHPAYAQVDNELAIEIRNKAVQARVVPSPFVPRRVKR
jgi:aminomethyltransferase